MKKFDYLCIAYCIVLLIFGFKDEPAKQNPTAHAVIPLKSQQTTATTQPLTREQTLAGSLIIEARRLK